MRIEEQAPSRLQLRELKRRSEGRSSIVFSLLYFALRIVEVPSESVKLSGFSFLLLAPIKRSGIFRFKLEVQLEWRKRIRTTYEADFRLGCDYLRAHVGDLGLCADSY